MEITEEKVKELAELVKKVDVKSLSEVIISLLRAYSELAITVGTIQKEHRESFEAIIHLGRIAPQFMEKFAEKAPPEIFGTFVRVSLRLAILGPRLDRIMELPPNEKIEIGKELKKLADDFENIVKLMEKKENVKT